MTGSGIDLYPGLRSSMLTAVHGAVPKILAKILQEISPQQDFAARRFRRTRAALALGQKDRAAVLECL
jgi:hypothetical protein